MAEIKLIGSKINKLGGFRSRDFKGKPQIKTKINELSTSLSKEAKDVLELNYSFEVDYGALGNISIGGTLYLRGDEKNLKQIQASLKEKGISSKEQLAIHSLILQKASIKALAIGDELGLPPHISLPTLSLRKD